jgi:hypothetical protein
MWKSIAPYVGAAVVGAALGAEPASACWPFLQSCLPPPVQFERRVITVFHPEYRTEYREVQHTVYHCVPETRQQQVQETVLVPHWRDEQRQRTVLVPQTREETRQRTIVRTEWREEQRQRTVLVPETREVERKFTVCVPAWREEQRARTVLVPEVREEERQRTFTAFRSVPDVQQRQVVCYQPVRVPICDPCTGWSAVCARWWPMSRT